MAVHDYNNIQVLVQGKPVETKLMKYEAPKTGNHIEFYNLSKKYEKLLSKLLRLSNKDKIYKNIDKSLEQINSLINEIQPAVEKISKNPSSIIFGSDSSDPEIKVSKK